MLNWIVAQSTPVVALTMLAYDQPFSAGGVRVLPTALENVLPN